MFARLLAATVVAGALVAAPAQAVEDPVTDPTAVPTATPTTPAPVLKTITVRQRPKVEGTARYGKTLKRTVGRYSVGGNTYKTRWLRDGKPIKGATKARYKIRPRDVGHRIRVRVSVKHPGYRTIIATSKGYRRIKHMRDARHTVKYTISTRGSISTSVKTFRRQVDQTLNDPRGWASAGIRFKRVGSGGSMSVVLSQASLVPSFSWGCSSQWSCRVGRYVIINQDRWKYATPAWNAGQGTTRRGYRHMVVNHEVGHWLGWHHSSCGGKGQKAPIMMQQSKGRDGCVFNPWPKPNERNVPRYR